jgi:hypothetical protein
MDSPTRAGEGDVPEAVDVTTTDGVAGVGDKALVGAALGGAAVTVGAGRQLPLRAAPADPAKPTPAKSDLS